jgi:hypothetical protein
MKSIIIIILLVTPIFGLIKCVRAQNQKQSDTSLRTPDDYTNHEGNSKVRFYNIQTELATCVKNKDLKGIELISAQLDAQLKLEDYLIKFRQVDGVKLMTLSTVLVPALVSILTAFLTLFFSNRNSKKSRDRKQQLHEKLNMQ